MSEIPGLIVGLDGESMVVRVPTGAGCESCAGKEACSFLGPASAYRTLRLPREEWCRAGQRIRVEEPASTLLPAIVALVVLPLVLLIGGRWLLESSLDYPFAALSAWTVGLGIWLAGLWGTERIMRRAARFQAKVHPA